MLNILEEAIIYATVMHQGKTRKFGNTPYILHPLEVAQILPQQEILKVKIFLKKDMGRYAAAACLILAFALFAAGL